MPNESTIPDIYAEFVNVLCTNLSVLLGFRATSFHDVLTENEDVEAVELKAIIRLNHVPAKALAIILKRALKELENQYGTISVPRDLAESIGFEEGEW